MPGSKLFSLANGRKRQAAKRAFERSPIGGIAKLVRRYSRSKRKAERLVKAVSTGDVQRLLKYVGDQGGPERYSQKSEIREAFDQIFSALGPLGQILKAVTGIGDKTTGIDASVAAATELIRSVGGEVLTKPGQPGHARGLEAAKQILEESGLEVRPPGSAGDSSGKPPRQPGDDDAWPAEHSIVLLGRGDVGYDADGQRKLIEREIKTPGSSNVYSFVFQRESKRTGILYVTFLGWTPGSRERSGAGPTYAYYDVPIRIYEAFKRMAASTAGGAVWDYLRVRGTVYGHQYQYRLTSGTLMQDGGQYVPRKATPKGFKRRAVPDFGVGKRKFTRSQLPERTFSRGEPNRGTPNRGKPNRG